MKNETTLIGTGLYGPTAFAILKSTLNLMKRARVYTRKTLSTAECSTIVKTPSGEVAIRVDHTNSCSYTRSAFFASTQRKSLEYIANYVKGTAKICLKYEKRMTAVPLNTTPVDYAKVGVDGWRRDSDSPAWMIKDDDGKVFATVSHLYLVYEALSKRRDFARKYSPRVVADVVGEPYDPIRTELELAKIEEEKRLNEELSRKINEINAMVDAKYDEQEQARKRIRDEFDAYVDAASEKINRLRAEYKTAVEDMKRRFDSTIAAA